MDVEFVYVWGEPMLIMLPAGYGRNGRNRRGGGLGVHVGTTQNHVEQASPSPAMGALLHG